MARAAFLHGGQGGDRRGLYAGAFAAYMPMVEGDWMRWLAGKEGWQAAVDGMVEGLAPANRAVE